MALAPSTEPVVPPKTAAKETKAPIGPSKSAYRTKVWSALARHKPRLGKPGSTTVSFVIGPSGSLRSVRVSRSSGNAGLDQQALRAVRNAAPFPAPPGGSAPSYTIQIYFR
jgi:protein TonB